MTSRLRNDLENVPVTCSHIVGGLLKPRISKKQNVQESEKTFLFLQIMFIRLVM